MNIENQTQTFQNKEFQGGALKGSLGSASGNYGLSADNQYFNLNPGEGGFKEELQAALRGAEGILSPEYNINDILNDMDILESVSLDTVNIEKADAAFFINLLNGNGILNYSVSGGGNIIDARDYKPVEVSKTLSSLLSRAYETNKAIRLDFDNNVTVILKVTEDGKVDARFIPGDKIVEEYLKNNIPYLKQRFDEQNIPYANISYKQQKHRESGQNNKEKNNNE